MSKKRKVKNDFVMLPRCIFRDLSAGRLKVKEYLLLTILWLSADIYNATWEGSYAELAELLSVDKISKNQVNKAMLGLKRKEYIKFPKSQGRSRLEVKVNRYPRVNGGITDLFCNKSQKHNKTTAKDKKSFGRSKAEPRTNEQKFKQVAKDKYGKSNNNDKEKNKNKNDISLGDKSNNIVPIESYKPNNQDGAKCKEFAEQLGEEDMRFILSAKGKYGINIVERSFYIVMDTPDVINKGAYFNKVVKELGEKNNGKKT